MGVIGRLDRLQWIIHRKTHQLEKNHQQLRQVLFRNCKNPFHSLFLLDSTMRQIYWLTIGSRPTPETCFLPGQLRRTFLPKERYDYSLSGRGSNTQPFHLWGGHFTAELSLPPTYFLISWIGPGLSRRYLASLSSDLGLGHISTNPLSRYSISKTKHNIMITDAWKITGFLNQWLHLKKKLLLILTSHNKLSGLYSVVHIEKTTRS